MSKSTSTSGGIGFFGLLAIAFIVLKLVGIKPVADWSWIWVLSPLWIPVVIAAGIMLLVAFFIMILCKD